MLSLCMLVRTGEEKFLDTTFAAVKGYVEEIILVGAVTPRQNAQTYAVAWKDDIAAARNLALAKATQPWILVLDPKERIAPEDFLKLRHILTQASFDGISFVIRNYTHAPPHQGCLAASGVFAQGFGGYVPALACRLFRNKPHIRFRYRIYEQVDETILENGGKIVKVPIPVHNYQGSLTKKELEQYLTISLQQLKELPTKPKPYYDTALLYRQSHKLELALSFFEKAAALDENYLFPYREIGNIYAMQKKWAEAKNAYEKSLALCTDVESWLNLGVVHEQLGDMKAAAQCFVKALSLEPLLVQGYYNLYALLVKTRRYVAAWRVLKAAMEKTKLEEFSIKQKQFGKKLLAAIDKELMRHPSDARLRAARAELFR